MKQFNDVETLLKFIADISKEDYYEGFYNIEPAYDDEGISGYSNLPLVIQYNNSLCEFFGGEIPDSATSWKYRNVIFKACSSQLDGFSRIAFGIHENQLEDECWCIEIPVSIENLYFEIEVL